MEFLRQPQNLCVVGMIMCFFLPWAQLFGLSASGFQLQNLGSYGNLAWVIPILAAINLFAAFNGNSKALPITTGIAPFIGLVYGLAKVGRKLFHVSAIGAYLNLRSVAAALALAWAVPSTMAQDTRPEFVIAVLGDSYASGEGSPDVHGNHSLGGDFIAPECIPRPGDPEPKCFSEKWWSPDSWFLNRLASFPQGDDTGWQDDARRCHRSSKAPGPHAAMQIAERFPDVKITVLDFACGGSKITDGLLFGWPGPEPPLGASDLLPSQVKALEDYISGTQRHVDAIVMNIGGNDLRFADLVKACIVDGINNCANDNLLTEIRSLLKDEVTPRFPDARAPMKARYKAIDAAFRNVSPPTGVAALESGQPDEVYLTGLPNPTHDAPPATADDFCNGTQSNDHSVLIPLFLPPLFNIPLPPIYRPGYQNVTRDESVAMESLIGGNGRSMNKVMNEAAKEHGWVFINIMFDITRDHGVCANASSFFRTNADALRIQGDEGLLPPLTGLGPIFISPGIAHQNEAGYAARASAIADVVEEQVRMRFRAPTLFLERVDPPNVFLVRWQDPSPKHVPETRWELGLRSPTGQVVPLSSAVGPGQDIRQTTTTPAPRFSWHVVREGEFAARLRGCRETPTGDYCGPFSNPLTVVTKVARRPIDLIRVIPAVPQPRAITVKWTPGPDTPVSVRYEVQHGPRTSVPIPCPGVARPGQTCSIDGIDFGSSASTTTTSFTVGDLTSGEYGFQVRACSTAGCSPFSSFLIVKLTGILGPVLPDIPPRELLPPPMDPQPRNDRNEPDGPR